jgi:1,2-dihydroxy-3-keto-5-methylthiopentene dioxygenase
MSALTVYPDNQPQHGELYTDFSAIQNQLNTLGVKFERWTANCPLSADAGQESVLAAFADSIDRLKREYGFQSVDVIKLTPDHPEKAVFRQKFLAEHIHKDFEVRFFVEGRGLFYLHIGDNVYAVLCEQGDLISVPANTTHWFDMGENPRFTCIRLFTTPEGWVADFTGSEIAKTFPTFDEYLAGLS